MLRSISMAERARSWTRDINRGAIAAGSWGVSSFASGTRRLAGSSSRVSKSWVISSRVGSFSPALLTLRAHDGRARCGEYTGDVAGDLDWGDRDCSVDSSGLIVVSSLGPLLCSRNPTMDDNDLCCSRIQPFWSRTSGGEQDRVQQILDGFLSWPLTGRIFGSRSPNAAGAGSQLGFNRLSKLVLCIIKGIHCFSTITSRCCCMHSFNRVLTSYVQEPTKSG